MIWNEKTSSVKFEDQPGFKEFQHEYRAAIKEVRTKIEILSEEFAVRNDYNPIHHLEHRLKSADNICEKLIRQECEVSIQSARDNLFDIAGVRVVCNFINDVYSVRDMLLSQDDITLIVEKDYIKNPKENGYRSLHLRIGVPVYLMGRNITVPVEVQIRTVAMDFWASTEHELRYKKDNAFTLANNIELKACAEVSAKLDMRMQKLFDQVNK